jgi:phasin family protein
MYNATEQFAELNKAGVDQALRLAQIAMDNTERLVKLQFDATKAAFEENVKNTKALAEAKDLQDLIALRTKLAENGVEKAVGYSRSIYEVASEAHAEVSKVVEEGLASYTKSVANLVEKAAKNAPAGSDAAVSALKSTVAATTAAIDTLTKASKQVASFADASVKAATQATTNVVKGAAAKKAA